MVSEVTTQTDADRIALMVCPRCDGERWVAQPVGLPSSGLAEPVPCDACADHPGYRFGSTVRGPCHHFDYGVEGKPFAADGFDPPWRFDDPDYDTNYVSEYDSCNCGGSGFVARLTLSGLLTVVRDRGGQLVVGVTPGGRFEADYRPGRVGEWMASSVADDDPDEAAQAAVCKALDAEAAALVKSQTVQS